MELAATPNCTTLSVMAHGFLTVLRHSSKKEAAKYGHSDCKRSELEPRCDQRRRWKLQDLGKSHLLATGIGMLSQAQARRVAAHRPMTQDTTST